MTIKDIAEICGVGTGTVSRALNNDPRVKKETRERILSVVKKHNFIPNSSARNLKLMDTNTVGLLCKGINNPFFQSMFHPMESELEKLGYSAFFMEVGVDEDEGEAALKLIHEKNIKGIIFLGGMMKDPDVVLRHVTVPYILCSVGIDMSSTPDCIAISVDDEKESEKAVSYLIKEGHERIAIIAGRKDDKAVGALRLSGYKKALEKHGIKYDPKLVFHMEDGIPDFSAENGYKTMKKVIKKCPDITAVFAISDVTALGAYKAIYEAGLRIPEDISVVGFDGIEYSKYLHPSLTTMVQPTDEMIHEATENIDLAIKGEGKAKMIYVGAKLVKRDSVKKERENGTKVKHTS